jgi:hypothetical protein
MTELGGERTRAVTAPLGNTQSNYALAAMVRAAR